MIEVTPTPYQQWFDSCEGQTEPDAERYRAAAKRLHEIEGEIEIDSNAVVSRSADNGAYVMAWVWVNAEEVSE